MPYDESFAQRIEKGLAKKEVAFEAKRLMGGLCFNVDDKMCVGLSKDKQSGDNYLIARVGEPTQQANIDEAGCGHFAPTGRIMKDFLIVEEWVLADDQVLDHWLDLCLAFNPVAKGSKKSTKK